MTPTSPQRAPTTAAKTANATETHPNTCTHANSEVVASALTTDLVKEFITFTTPLIMAASSRAPVRWYLSARTHRSIHGVITQMAATPATTTTVTSFASWEMRRRRSGTP